MQQIITITLSPCIDKSTTVPSLIPEKKLKCTSPVLEPGGGGINVARAIKKLGGTATAIIPIGGYTGKFLYKLIQDEGIPSIIIDIENETRENVIVLEESSHKQYRFGMPGTMMHSNEVIKLLQALQMQENVEYIVVSGSLPPGIAPDIIGKIARIAKTKNAKLIVDTSGEALRFAIREGAYMIKPNLGELSFLTGKDYLQSYEVVPAARQIIDSGSCKIIVTSLGPAGAMLITKDIAMTFTPPKLTHKSTVGAGDSMVAGIVLSLFNGKTIEEAVKYGVACGTAATLNPGTELCRKEDADKLFNLIKT